MDTSIELRGDKDENNNYEQVLSIKLTTTDSEGVIVTLGASIGVRPVDSVKQVVDKLRRLANAFEDAEKKI